MAGMKSGIGPHQQLLLDQFGQLVEAAWGELGYRVGSSTRGADWRDIDIRVMLSNDEFERRLGRVWQEGLRHRHLPYRAEMLAWSTLGHKMTGLPIDFQVQRLTEADAKYPDGYRIPIGLAMASIEEESAGRLTDEADLQRTPQSMMEESEAPADPPSRFVQGPPTIVDVLTYEADLREMERERALSPGEVRAQSVTGSASYRR
jgi:hypothetical protein